MGLTKRIPQTRGDPFMRNGKEGRGLSIITSPLRRIPHRFLVVGPSCDRALDRPYLGLSLDQRTGPAGGLNVSIPEIPEGVPRILMSLFICF